MIVELCENIKVLTDVVPYRSTNKPVNVPIDVTYVSVVCWIEYPDATLCWILNDVNANELVKLIEKNKLSGKETLEYW